jgi:hypothetical protein
MIHGDRDDLLWLAGLLEGEGTFDAHRGKYPRIRLAMTDRDVVGRAASLMDTKIRLALHPAPAQPTWHSEVSGEKAAEIMREILPHMGSRRSGKIAGVLGIAHFRETGKNGVEVRHPSSTPGPQVTRPAGIAKPATAAA